MYRIVSYKIIHPYITNANIYIDYNSIYVNYIETYQNIYTKQHRKLLFWLNDKRRKTG